MELSKTSNCLHISLSISSAFHRRRHGLLVHSPSPVCDLCGTAHHALIRHQDFIDGVMVYWFTGLQRRRLGLPCHRSLRIPRRGLRNDLLSACRHLTAF